MIFRLLNRVDDRERCRIVLIYKLSSYGKPTVGLKSTIIRGTFPYVFRTFTDATSKINYRELKSIARRLRGCFQIYKRTQQSFKLL